MSLRAVSVRPCSNLVAVSCSEQLVCLSLGASAAHWCRPSIGVELLPVILSPEISTLYDYIGLVVGFSVGVVLLVGMQQYFDKEVSLVALYRPLLFCLIHTLAACRKKKRRKKRHKRCKKLSSRRSNSMVKLLFPHLPPLPLLLQQQQ